MANRFMCDVKLGVIRVALLSTLPIPAFAIDLSDNTESASSGVETANATRWLCASFGTGSSAHELSSITLNLANPTAGTAFLDLFSNGGLEPGTLVATLTSPDSYSSTLAATTFQANGTALSANTTYWVVLRPQSGSFEWSWTSSNSGTGDGFQHTWGDSPDSGAAWWTFDSYQVQMAVTVDAPCSIPGDLNTDQSVDLSDLSIMLSAFGSTGGSNGADIDGDGDVDLSDLSVLLANFGANCR